MQEPPLREAIATSGCGTIHQGLPGSLPLSWRYCPGVLGGSVRDLEAHGRLSSPPPSRSAGSGGAGANGRGPWTPGAFARADEDRSVTRLPVAARRFGCGRHRLRRRRPEPGPKQGHDRQQRRCRYHRRPTDGPAGCRDGRPPVTRVAHFMLIGSWTRVFRLVPCGMRRPQCVEHRATRSALCGSEARPPVGPAAGRGAGP